MVGLLDGLSRSSLDRWNFPPARKQGARAFLVQEVALCHADALWENHRRTNATKRRQTSWISEGWVLVRH
jgi:hypothetical protein